MVDEVMKFITEADPEVGEAIEAEAARQRRNLELIASENIVSEPVMMAMGSVLTNKYAEGYPGKRYYGGCQCVDVVESIAIERAKKLFGCDYANVQPHSGAQANMAVFIAMLKPGDTVMGMNLDHGGHLTHGSPVNFSGLYFNIVPYGVDDNGVIDYEEVERIALEAKPKLIIAGASAYAREIDFPFPSLRCSGTSICIFPLRYCEVSVSVRNISSGVPAKTTSPPSLPAFGPMSTI
mgnify:CR=1 FL=1